MKLKVKLVSIIASMVMIMAILTVGVWAVNKATINLGGTITFDVTHINAYITGQVEGAKETAALTSLTFDNGTTDATRSWGHNLTFENDQRDIVITVTIKNNSDSTIKGKITNNSSATNLDSDMKKGSDSYASGEAFEVVGKDTEVTFTFTLSIKVKNSPVSGNYSFKFELEDQNYVAPAA